MAKRVVVMEMGHRALHGLEVEKRLGEFQVVDYHVEEWQAGMPAPLDPLFSSLIAGNKGEKGEKGEKEANPAWTGLFANWPFSREGIVTAFPAELCTFRLIELPFQQSKKIAQIIAYEAESYLPFDLDEILLGYVTAWRREQATDVLVAGAGREEFSRFLSGMLQAGVEPASVSASGLCLYALSKLEDNLLPQPQARMPAFLEEEKKIKWPPHCRAYLDIGARQSRLCVVREGLPLHVSSLSFGGDDLTRILAEEFHLSWEQAEAGKRLEARVGEDPEQLGAQEARLVRLLEQGLAPLWRWLEHNWRWLERRRRGIAEIVRCEELVLCGGTANLRGLAAAVEAKFGIPTRVFRLPPALLDGGRPVPEELQPALAEPLALALVDPAQRGEPAINFRQGEFAYQREAQIYRQKLLFPAVLLAALLLMISSRYLVARTGVAHQIREIQNRMKEQVQTQLGAPPTGDPVEFVQGKLKEAEAKLEKYQALKRPRAMEVFAACSEKIPIEVLVDLSKFTYHEDKVQLEGETADFNRAKEIQDYLQTIPFFSKVTLEDTRQSTTGRTRFSVQISLGAKSEARSAERKAPKPQAGMPAPLRRAP